MLQAALSTMWMRERHRSLEEFFEAGSQLGFERFELNHWVSQELVQATRFPPEVIQGVHAPCPVHPRTRDAEISSLDKDERAAAVEAVTASLHLAEQLGAPVVILHAGVVPVDPQLDRQLRDLYNQGRRNGREYADLKAELLKERARQAERHLDATRRSLERLATLADALGVRIALENRFCYQEIPTPDELDLLLDEFAGPVAFWFDTGHAYCLEELGFIPHREWLTGFSQHLLGCHLHDMRSVAQPTEVGGSDGRPPQGPGLRDHDIPGTGVIDFAEVLRLAPPGSLFTCEFETYHPPEQVKAGLEYLRQLWLQLFQAEGVTRENKA